MQTRNADPITDRGDYALNNDESGLIRGRIVEEPLMGKNAARRFQKELNEIVEDHVPLTFLPVWEKIRIKMQKVIKKHFKKQDLLVRWNKNAVLTSEVGLYTRNAFTVEYYTQPAGYEIQNLRVTRKFAQILYEMKRQRQLKQSISKLINSNKMTTQTIDFEINS